MGVGAKGEARTAFATGSARCVRMNQLWFHAWSENLGWINFRGETGETAYGPAADDQQLKRSIPALSENGLLALAEGLGMLGARRLGRRVQEAGQRAEPSDAQRLDPESRSAQWMPLDPGRSSRLDSTRAASLRPEPETRQDGRPTSRRLGSGSVARLPGRRLALLHRAAMAPGTTFEEACDDLRRRTHGDRVGDGRAVGP